MHSNILIYDSSCCAYGTFLINHFNLIWIYLLYLLFCWGTELLILLVLLYHSLSLSSRE